jgi:hypothetical protein
MVYNHLIWLFLDYIWSLIQKVFLDGYVTTYHDKKTVACRPNKCGLRYGTGTVSRCVCRMWKTVVTGRWALWRLFERVTCRKYLLSLSSPYLRYVYAILECLTGDSQADGVQSKRSKQSKCTPGTLPGEELLVGPVEVESAPSVRRRQTELLLVYFRESA